MSAPQLERNFVGSLTRRCSTILFNRIESNTSVGFPDLVLVWNGQVRLVEAKVVHPGDWVYVRNTQVAWCHKARQHGFDCPFLLGMAGQGMGLFHFSRLFQIGGQLYKATHRRYKLHEIQPLVVSKYDDWQAFVLRVLYTTD